MSIRLRNVVDDDLPTFFLHQCDPVSVQMVGFVPRTRQVFMSHWRRNIDDPRVNARAVLDGAAPVGHVVSFDRDGGRTADAPAGSASVLASGMPFVIPRGLLVETTHAPPADGG